MCTCFRSMRRLLHLCLEMSERAYLDTSCYTISQASGCRVVIQPLGDSFVIAFAGSESSTDWLMNSIVKRASFHGCAVHCGFLIQYNSVRHQIMAYLGSMRPQSIICSGHSLGGALATLCALDLALLGHNTICVTFGSPRVGCDRFAKQFATKVQSSTRVAHWMDPVTYVPMRFTHVPGHCVALHTCTLRTHALQSYYACLHNEPCPKTIGQLETSSV